MRRILLLLVGSLLTTYAVAQESSVVVDHVQYQVDIEDLENFIDNIENAESLKEALASIHTFREDLSDNGYSVPTVDQLIDDVPALLASISDVEPTHQQQVLKSFQCAGKNLHQQQALSYELESKTTIGGSGIILQEMFMTLIQQLFKPMDHKACPFIESGCFYP